MTTRTITDNATKPATARPASPDRPAGRPVPAYLRGDAQTRSTPSRPHTKQAERLPATRSPSR